MKRYVSAAAIIFGVVGLGQVGCGSTGVGDPCTPESEYSATGGGAVLTDLAVDLNSTQCDTRVCLQHFFQGRVTCPYGNNNAAGTTADSICKAVDGFAGLYTKDGTGGAAGSKEGDLCCPIVGDETQHAITKPVKGQCASRPVTDAVYCTCRCAVPDGVDAKTCACPDGYSCEPLFNNKALPLGKQGSYCVKKGKNGSDLKADATEDALIAACGSEVTRP
jgi:hypothetical protein